MTPAKQFDLCPWGKLNALPHMGWQHAGWFASYVVNARNILEWGCGGSTLWMAMMNPKARLLSVEHEEKWARWVVETWGVLRERGIDVGEASPITWGQVKPGDPTTYTHAHEVKRCKPYDLIFVDGHERCACLEASYDLLQPGGVVFLHDSQRPQYSKAKRKLLEREGMTLIDERTDESWINPRAGMWAAQKS